MKSEKKNKVFLIAIVLLSTIVTSCNRGTGCPNSFSLKSIFELFGL